MFRPFVTKSVVVCLWLGLAALGQNRILRPNLALPTLTTSHATVTVVLETQPALQKRGAAPHAVLEAVTDGARFSVPVLRQAPAPDRFDLRFAKFHPAAVRWETDIQIGAVPPGLYHLELTVDGTALTAYNAVSVVADFDRTWKVLHISDTHIGADGALEEYEKTVRDANLLNPDFIICTGDIADAARADWYAQFVATTRKLQVPIFVVDGNHDYYDDAELTLYQQIVNPYPNYAAAFGDVLLINLDTGADLGWTQLWRCNGLTEDQLDWLGAQLRAEDARAVKLIGMHGPFYDAFTPNKHGLAEFVSLCRTHDVTFALAGHTHKDQVNDMDGRRKSGDLAPFPGTIFVQTTTACKAASVVLKNGTVPPTDLPAALVDALPDQQPDSVDLLFLAENLPADMQTDAQKSLVTDKLGYRLITLDHGSVTGYTAEGSADNSLETYGWSFWYGTRPNLDVVRTTRSDGSLQATVTNRHGQAFDDCRVRFDVQPGAAYEVVQGPATLVGTTDAGVLTLAFPLPADTTLTLTVRRR